MTKLLPHIFFILVLLQSQLYNSFVVTGYEISYEYYSKQLCENQDKPALHCNGKCFLSKQLALSDSQQNQTEPPVLIPILKLFQLQSFNFNALLIVDECPFFPRQRNFSLRKAPFRESADHPPRV